jgi:hypothetical protein
MHSTTLPQSRPHPKMRRPLRFGRNGRQCLLSKTALAHPSGLAPDWIGTGCLGTGSLAATGLGGGAALGATVATAWTGRGFGSGSGSGTALTRCGGAGFGGGADLSGGASSATAARLPRGFSSASATTGGLTRSSAFTRTATVRRVTIGFGDATGFGVANAGGAGAKRASPPCTGANTGTPAVLIRRASALSRPWGASSRSLGA